jgi:hypothetical protein
LYGLYGITNLSEDMIPEQSLADEFSSIRHSANLGKKKAEFLDRMYYRELGVYLQFAKEYPRNSAVHNCIGPLHKLEEAKKEMKDRR